MRFSRIRVARFGGIRDLDTGEEPLPAIVVVQGPNEAGKTSLFHFLTAVLYGFYPASREGNPYTPWDGGEIEGRAVLALEDGAEWTVHRRLLSSGWGRLTRNGRVEDIRNQDLPCVGHVPLELFRDVYALTLSDLAGLEGKSWGAVQDRLVGALGASDLRSAREVWTELEKEADALWRPDRIGKPRARELAAELRELRSRKREASDRDRTLREKSRTLREAREDLQEARLRRSEVRTRLERMRTLLPLREQLLRVDELLDEAGPEELLQDIPPDPAGRLEELRREIEGLNEERKELERQAAEQRARVHAFDEEERKVLEAEDEIGRLAAHAASAERAEARRAALERELREKERRIDGQLRELFDDPPSLEELVERTRTVPLGALRERIREYLGAREDRRTREAAERWMAPGEGRHRGWTAAGALILFGVVLVVAGLSGQGMLAAVLGLAAIGVGLVTGLWERSRGARGGADRARRQEELSRARDAEETRRREVQALLDELPLHASLLDHPTLEIATGLERLMELGEDRAERLRDLDDVRRAEASLERRVRALRDRLGLDLPAEPGPAIHLLDRALARAEDRAAEARAGERELERIEETRSKIADRAGEREEALARLEDRLRGIGGGDLERGASVARRRMEARRRARSIVEELQRSHPDLEELKRRIAEATSSGEAWTLDEEALAEARAAEEALTDRVEALERKVAGLDRDLEHLRSQETMDEVEGAIRAVRERMAGVARERDRKYLLARLVREADRRFREAHEPALVRRAAEHLDAITGGRYRRLQLGEGDEGEAFFLEGPDYPSPLPVREPISKGTREQVYLALRLAIVDHLDERAETLPLFIDEAFVNWDRERRQRGFDVLEEVSRERQLFVFTCHPELGRELEGRGGRVLELPPA